MSKTLETILYPAVDAVRDTVERGDELKKSATAPLYGDGAPLNSLGLVSFVIEVEERVATATGKTVRLVTPAAMSRKHSPFRTLGSLAEYVDELLTTAT